MYYKYHIFGKVENYFSIISIFLQINFKTPFLYKTIPESSVK
jgi:hypothetical protein